MRQSTPICFVPQLNATLLTRHADIFICEKNVEVFSSDQPGGLMNVLMGQNMMRKDGDAHLIERRQAQPAWSPKSVKSIWKVQCEQATDSVLDTLDTKSSCDLVQDFAMPVSAHALRFITGLTNLTTEQMDFSSQAMIDGIANYENDQAIQQRCNEGTRLIDASIDEMLLPDATLSEHSLLAVLLASQQPIDSIRANIKLAISGGQNEPRDAIAGVIWALLTHAEQLHRVLSGKHTWLKAFEEYARWISPIGMSPRRIAKNFTYNNVTFKAEDRAFLMFASGNRDRDVFTNPDLFDIARNTSKSLSFGAGPHFCAGAAASRMLIADVALPRLFKRFPQMQITGPVQFSGWAFRGPLQLPVKLLL